MKLHIKIEVTGKVQGVYYRKSTLMKANELTLCGYVENCDNGSVYIEAEGHMDKLESLISWCHQGPDQAEVKDVVVMQYPELKGYDEFWIKREDF